MWSARLRKRSRRDYEEDEIQEELIQQELESCTGRPRRSGDRRALSANSFRGDKSKELPGRDGLLHTEPLQENSCERDEEFWFEDGSIELVARNVKFRVYKTALAEHSLTFADMISFPQPSSALQPVPLYDSPEDLRHIFRAIFPRKGATLIHADSMRSLPSIHALSAYVRLGQKYQFDNLVSQALQYLQEYFNKDLKAWINKRFFIPLPMETIHSIGVVNIARATDCDILLPIALAICCTLDPMHIQRGYVREDGKREKLSPEDARRCLDGKINLMKETVALLLHTFSPHQSDYPGCSKPGESQGCRLGKHQLLYKCQYDIDMVTNDHPFGRFESYADAEEMVEQGVCSWCQGHLKKRFIARQHDIWKRLPLILGLGEIAGWGEPQDTEGNMSEDE